jgi:tetratricopeptide (TPR) repeat protein
MFYFGILKFSCLLMIFMSSMVKAADNEPMTDGECLMGDSFARAEEEYWEMFENKKLEIGVVNNFLNALVNAKQYDDAGILLNSLIEHEWFVDSFTVNIGLKYLFWTNQYAKAEELFKNIPEGRRNNHSFYWMFRLYCVYNEFSKAEEMFNNIDFSLFHNRMAKGVTMFEMGHLYRRHNQEEKAAKIFEEITKNHLLTENFPSAH